MKKYRARLKNGKIIGPLGPNGFRELAQKGHVSCEETFQEFPVGDWSSVEQFPELKLKIVEGLDAQKNEEATFVRKLSDLEKGLLSSDELLETPEQSFPKEFSYDSPSDDEDLPQESVEDTDKTELLDLDVENIEVPIQETELRTRAMNRGNEENEDKTQISPATIAYLEEKRKSEAEEKKLAEQIEEEAPGPEVDPIDENIEEDSTQMLSLAEIKDGLAEETAQAQKELELEAKRHKRENEKVLIKKEEAPLEETPSGATPKEVKKKKKIIVYLAVVLLVVFFILPDEQKKRPNDGAPKLIYPQISFPQRYDKPDEAKAQALLKKAAEVAAKETYVNNVKAANYYRASLENKWKSNPASASLIFTYADLLKHSQTKLEDANRIFKLVQIFNTAISEDAVMATGIALFYLEMNRAEAAIKTVEVFNTVKSSRPTAELFAVYLAALVKAGDLVKAEAVKDKLLSQNEHKLFSYLRIIDYFIFKGNYAKASEVLVEALKKKGEKVPLLLRQAELLLYDQDFESLEAVLVKIKKAQAGNSRHYYAQYLEKRGLLAVRNENPKLALSAFKKALKLEESLELRSRLASLGAGADKETNSLINESKSIELMAKAKAHWKKGNIKFAFRDALEATRVAPNYLPAQIYLASLQVKRSFFKEAIEKLEELYKKHPHNAEVVFSLIDAYIESYKFDKVKKLLNILANSDLRRDPAYYSKMAKYFVYKDEFKGAVMWLQESINKNPLDDENIYELAKMFIRYRKYNQAKVLLKKAMDLDPSNVDYRVSYADILYETDSSSAAIGYLYDVLKDFPDNAKILSAIGIYYYRSGQIKMFKSTKDKLLSIPDEDPALYEFLVKAAKIDQKFEDVIKYANKLIELNPGDLRTRMFLGQIYLEMSKYAEAVKQFNAVKDRLETYPKLQYFMSKLNLLIGKLDEAKELAEKEIKGNPDSINGYLLMAEILKKEEKFIEAEKMYKKAQRIDPKNVDVLVGLAYISFMKSQYEIALDLFQKAKRFEPGRAETYKLLGDVYRKIGQSSLAVESYKMFLELSPKSRYKENLENYIRMMQ